MDNFFKNKTILITGHTGFKGSWLSLWLSLLEARIIGFALHPPTNPNLYTLANVNKKMISIIGDIRDYNTLLNVIKKYKPEIVIHMAAQPLVLYSYENPIETYQVNALGTVNLLEAIRQTKCTKTILNITTDKCYENNNQHRLLCESDTLGGHDPYSNSKACSELITSAYRHSYFNHIDVGLATARAGNVIGGGDWADNRLIPDIINACLNEKAAFIRAPNSVRPWQHVLEPLNGYLKLIEHLYNHSDQYSEAWNFGPDKIDIKPVSWISDYMIKQWGNKAGWYTESALSEITEATFLSLTSDKAKQKLNWHPKWGLEEALNKTIDWFKAFQTKQDMYSYTLTQIQSYMDAPLKVINDNAHKNSCNETSLMDHNKKQYDLLI